MRYCQRTYAAKLSLVLIAVAVGCSPQLQGGGSGGKDSFGDGGAATSGGMGGAGGAQPSGGAGGAQPSGGAGGGGAAQCPPACGPGESCCGGACVEGFCAPEVLVDNQSPFVVAVDQATDSIFWTSRNKGVFRVNRDGSGYTPLYSSMDPFTAMDPIGIVADESGIYWAVHEGIMWGEKDGSASATIFAPVQIKGQWSATFESDCIDPTYTSVATDATHVYFTARDCGSVVRTPKGGGDGEIVIHADSQAMPSFRVGDGLALDAGSIYMTRGLWTASVSGSDLAHLGPAVIDHDDEGLAVDDEYIYVVGHGELRRVKKDGSAASVLATWPECGTVHVPFNIVLDDTYVYWLEQCSDEVRRIAKAGGTEEVVSKAPLGAYLVSIAADEDHVYWAALSWNDPSDGRIMKWKKP